MTPPEKYGLTSQLSYSSQRQTRNFEDDYGSFRMAFLDRCLGRLNENQQDLDGICSSLGNVKTL